MPLPSSTNEASLVTPLEALAQTVASCKACGLCHERTQTVFGDGPPTARLMVIGEGPGQHEDEQGLPFVGRSGQLLTHMLAAAGFYRASKVGPQAANVYIANIVKCRPPNNRAPQTTEMAACKPYLEAQIKQIKPASLALAGAPAVKGILGPAVAKTGITQLRGQWFATSYQGSDGQPIHAMPLFHPAYLLRNPSQTPGSPKTLMTQDLALIHKELVRRTQ